MRLSFLGMAHKRKMIVLFGAAALVSGSALGQVGVVEFETCRDRTAPSDTRIFACSRVISDTAQPVDIIAKAYFDRANAYLAVKQYDNALADFIQAITLKPNSIYYLKRASVYSLKGDNTHALSDVMELIRPDAHMTFGSFFAKIFIKAGAVQQGLQYANQEIEKGPNTPFTAFTYEARAMFEEAMGHKDDAVADFRKALSLGKEIVPPIEHAFDESRAGLERLGVSP